MIRKEISFANYGPHSCQWEQTKNFTYKFIRLFWSKSKCYHNENEIWKKKMPLYGWNIKMKLFSLGMENIVFYANSKWHKIMQKNSS